MVPMRRMAVLVLLTAACGGPQKARESGPSCAEVAARMTTQAARGGEVPPDSDLSAGVQAEFERQCRDDHWSMTRRRCLVESPSQEAALSCPAE